MRNVTYILVFVMVMTAMVGCGESAEQKAGSQLQSKIQEATRHFGRAAGLLGVTPIPADVTEPVPTINPKVLPALADAARTLTEALSEATDAPDSPKATAHGLLAEIHLAEGAYHGAVANDATSGTNDLIRLAERKIDLATNMTSLEAFCGELASLDTAAAAALLTRMRSERETEAAKVGQLTERSANLAARSEQIQKVGEEARQGGGELRMKIRTAVGVDKLELDARASAMEAKYEQAGSELGAVQVDQANVAEELKIVSSRLARLSERADLSARGLASLQTRSQMLEKRRMELLVQRKAVCEELAALATEVGAGFAGSAKAFDAGLGSYRKASRANDASLRSLRDLKAKAREMSGRDSPMKSIIDEMSGRGMMAAATARKGDIALADADAQRRFLMAYRRVAGFTNRAKATCAAAGVTAATELQVALAAVDDLDSRQEEADEKYGVAADAYADVASKMLTGAPDNTRATKWMYQGFQARALLGRYRLTGDGVYRQDGLKLVTEVLTDHQGDPAFAPVRQTARDLAAG